VEKMEIVKIGAYPETSIEGWEFNGRGKGVGICYDLERGETLYAGYTLAELQKEWHATLIGEVRK
jgi:hypothetical protein